MSYKQISDQEDAKECTGDSDESNASTLICDQPHTTGVSNDINKQTLRFPVMKPNNETNEEPNFLNLKVQVVKGVDEVDRNIPDTRPDPEGQTGSSSNTSSPGSETVVVTEESEDSQLSVPDITKSPAFLKLEVELENAKKELQLKEKEVDRLSRIRDDVENELQELTASLFQEAHRMVGEANEKRVSSEKSLVEATMKIDGLETEVTALKTLVLTSTPSQPNRHLHPQIDRGESLSSAKKLTFNSSPRSKKNKSPSASNVSLVVVGAGGLNDSLNDSAATESESHVAFCDLGPDCDNTCGFFEERNIDPVIRHEFISWKKSPTLEQGSSQFLNRIYREDIDPCLDFASKDTRLRTLVVEAIHKQTICITPLKTEKFIKCCPLLNSDRVLCKYRVRLGQEVTCAEEGKEFCISQLARNRITAVCNLLNYLDYIKKGMVKSHSNDVYWEVNQLRKRIVLARLGFSPD